MIVDEILDAVVDAVTGVTVTTDSGAPSQFSHLQAFESLARSTSGDRVFMVSLNRADPDGWRDGTGTVGVGAFYVTVDVAVRYVNEGRTSWAFEQILAQDRRKIIDGVCQYVREQANVAGVGECLYIGGTITDSERSRAVVSSFSFRVEYQDTITRVA